MLLNNLSQTLGTPPLGIGTDYAKCFVLIPQATSITILDIQGMEKGVFAPSDECAHNSNKNFKIKGAWDHGGMQQMASRRDALYP